MSIKSKVITFKKRKHNPDPQSYNIYIVQHQKKKKTLECEEAKKCDPQPNEKYNHL